ncbi:MAG TPA: ornithine carbamoyltransferase [Treponemataceae bacterium]|nr:ornithine carbamoyltransferase [Treponemataceae bacterium]HOQ93412.1 ornithine carbamoyltransferase [Treponemataceae bacterium]
MIQDTKNCLQGRSLTNFIDYSADEIRYLIELALKVKKQAQNKEIHQRFIGKSLALLFEKRSTRTRCAFETAFGEEGGHPVFLSSHDIQLGAKESVEDTARVLGRMFSGIQFRGFSQEHVETLAKYAGVPVYNGLTDSFHPTQVLADMMTLTEIYGDLKGLHLAFCGDGRNNVARSLMLISAKLGLDFTIVSPKEFFPDSEILSICTPIAKKNNANITISDKISLVKGADSIYTDVWISMGEEALSTEKKALLQSYQVNKDLMALTGKKDSVFMHCLPAVKGEEVTQDIIEGSQSRVWDQAENRKHTIKAILLATL